MIRRTYIDISREHIHSYFIVYRNLFEPFVCTGEKVERKTSGAGAKFGQGGGGGGQKISKGTLLMPEKNCRPPWLCNEENFWIYNL